MKGAIPWPCRISSYSTSMSLRRAPPSTLACSIASRSNSSPNFVMFELAPDLRLGLWARRDVEPAPRGASDTGELAMAVGTNRRGRSALRRSEAQRRRHPAGAGDDGLRPDLPRRRPGRTSASGVLPCALTRRGPADRAGRSASSAPSAKGSNLISLGAPEQIDRDMLGSLAVFRNQDSGSSLVSLGADILVGRRATGTSSSKRYPYRRASSTNC